MPDCIFLLCNNFANIKQKKRPFSAGLSQLFLSRILTTPRLSATLLGRLHPIPGRWYGFYRNGGYGKCLACKTFQLFSGKSVCVTAASVAIGESSDQSSQRRQRRLNDHPLPSFRRERTLAGGAHGDHLTSRRARPENGRGAPLCF